MTVPISNIALAEYPFQSHFNTNIHLALDLGVRKTVGNLPGLSKKIFVSSEQNPSPTSIATFAHLHGHRNLHHGRKSHHDRLREMTF